MPVPVRVRELSVSPLQYGSALKKRSYFAPGSTATSETISLGSWGPAGVQCSEFFSRLVRIPSPTKAIAELAVNYEVKDIDKMILRVERRQKTKILEVLYESES